MATRRSTSSSSTATRSRRAITRVTTDHDEIRRWAEERGARPARVPGTDILRLDFPGYTGDETLEHISWDEFFEIFDRNNLALLFQEKTAQGRRSNFNKFIDRATAEEALRGRGRSPKTEAHSRRTSAGRRGRSRRTAARGRSTSARRNSRSRASSNRGRGRRRGRQTAKKASRSTRSTRSTRRRAA